MRTLPNVIAIALLGLFASSATAGENLTYYAKITSVDAKKMAISVEITSAAGSMKEKTQTLEIDEKKIKLSSKATGKAAKFSDFEKGQELAIYAEDGVPKQIQILPPKKD